MQVTCYKCSAVTSVDQVHSTRCPKCGCALFDEPSSASATTVYARETPAQFTEAPKSIGKYRVIRPVGEGAFGVVYQAYDEKLSCNVAIKVSRHRSSEKTTEMMLREARTMAKLRHPNIVRVLGADQTLNGDVYLILDWIDGPTLRAAAKKEPLSIDDSVEMIRTVADAVHAAHRAGFVHRDLKPANILISSEGVPFVSDFGLAIEESTQFERRGEFAGTVEYMAPEQVRGESQYLDGRADVWALGVILYELLGSRRPFRGSKEQVADEVCNREPPALQLANEEISDELDAIVRKCLAKRIDERFATAGALRDALAQYQNEASAPARSEGQGSLRLLVSLLLFAVVVGLLAMANNTLGRSDSDGGEQVSAELEPIRDYAKGKWTKLLSGGVVKRLMPGEETGSRLVANPEMEELHAIIHGRAFIDIGLITEPDCKIMMSVDQQRWAGDFAFYFGLHRVADGYQCQMIELLRRTERPNQNSFWLVRSIVKLNENFDYHGAQQVASAQIPHPGFAKKDWVMYFRNYRLESCTWDGRAMDSLVPDNEILDSMHSEGDFGFYIDDASIILSQFRINVE